MFGILQDSVSLHTLLAGKECVTIVHERAQSWIIYPANQVGSWKCIIWGQQQHLYRTSYQGQRFRNWQLDAKHTYQLGEPPNVTQINARQTISLKLAEQILKFTCTKCEPEDFNTKFPYIKFANSVSCVQSTKVSSFVLRCLNFLVLEKWQIRWLLMLKIQRRDKSFGRPESSPTSIPCYTSTR